MLEKKSLTAMLFDAAAIRKRMLPGAVIGYVLITVFLLVPGVTINPAWPKFWMIRPMIIVPLAGAAGAAFYHFMDLLRIQNGWKKWPVYALCIVVFIIGMFLGIVLGLDGTLWD